MTTFLSTQPLAISLLLFLLSACLIAFFGIRMTSTARDLASVTGMGEALMMELCGLGVPGMV